MQTEYRYSKVKRLEAEKELAKNTEKKQPMTEENQEIVV